MRLCDAECEQIANCMRKLLARLFIIVRADVWKWELSTAIFGELKRCNAHVQPSL